MALANSRQSQGGGYNLSPPPLLLSSPHPVTAPPSLARRYDKADLKFISISLRSDTQSCHGRHSKLPGNLPQYLQIARRDAECAPFSASGAVKSSLVCPWRLHPSQKSSLQDFLPQNLGKMPAGYCILYGM